MSTGASKLREYLTAKSLKPSAFADSIGRSRPLVSMWMNEERKPGRDNALLLEHVTAGAVPASSWNDPAEQLAGTRPGAAGKRKRRRSKSRHARTIAQQGGRA